MAEQIFEEITDIRSPNLVKKLIYSLWTPSRINPKRFTPRYIRDKLSKQRILEVAREKQPIAYKQFLISLIAYFPLETMETEGNGMTHIQGAERKGLATKNSICSKAILEKTKKKFPGKQKNERNHY